MINGDVDGLLLACLGKSHTSNLSEKQSKQTKFYYDDVSCCVRETDCEKIIQHFSHARLNTLAINIYLLFFCWQKLIIVTI